MKIVSYLHNGTESYGVLTDRSIIDINSAINLKE